MNNSVVDLNFRASLASAWRPPPRAKVVAAARQFIGVREGSVFQTRQLNDLGSLGFGDVVTIPGIVRKLANLSGDRFDQSTPGRDMAGLPEVGVGNPQ